MRINTAVAWGILIFDVIVTVKALDYIHDYYQWLLLQLLVVFIVLGKSLIPPRQPESGGEGKPFTNRQTRELGIKAGLVSMLLFVLWGTINSIIHFQSLSDFIRDLGTYITMSVFYLWPTILIGIAGAFIGNNLKKTPRAIWVGALAGSVTTSAVIAYVLFDFCIGLC